MRGVQRLLSLRPRWPLPTFAQRHAESAAPAPASTSMPRIRLSCAKPQHDRRARPAAAGRRRPRRRPVRRRPAPGSARSSGGWPNRCPRDRRGARSGTTNRCAGSACRAVVRMESGSNSAASISTSRVAVGDLGPGPAHHAADGHGPLGVGDHAHARLQRVRLVVDGLDRLAGPRLADDDLRPRASLAR